MTVVRGAAERRVELLAALDAELRFLTICAARDEHVHHFNVADEARPAQRGGPVLLPREVELCAGVNHSASTYVVPPASTSTPFPVTRSAQLQSIATWGRDCSLLLLGRRSQRLSCAAANRRCRAARR